MALDDFPKINHDSQAAGEQGSVNKHSYWKWPFVVDFSIEHGDFP